MTQWTANWWALGLRSAAAIMLGIIALTWPEASMTAIAIMFGVFAIAEGIFDIAAAVHGLKSEERWAPMLLKGIVDLLAGGIALFWPGLGALAIVFLLATWGISTGILEIVAGVRLRKVMDHELMPIVAGALSIALGVLVAAYPGTGMVLIVWWLGAYAMAYGVASLVLTLHVKHWSDSQRIGLPV